MTDDAGSDTARMGLVPRRLVLLAAVLLGAVIVGVALSLMKGDGIGLTYWLGNLSAPYVIVAALGGRVPSRWWTAALLGVSATEVCLGGFYGAWMLLLRHDVPLRSLLLWGGAGLFSGAVFGVVGWLSRLRPGWLYMTPLVLLVEPVAVSVGGPAVGFGDFTFGPARLLAYGIEVLVGCAVLHAVRRQLRVQRWRSGLHLLT